MKSKFGPRAARGPARAPHPRSRSPRPSIARGPARAPYPRIPSSPGAVAAQRGTLPRPSASRHSARGPARAPHRARTPSNHPARMTGGPRLSSPTLLPLLCFFLPDSSAMVTPPASLLTGRFSNGRSPSRSQPPRTPQTLASRTQAPYTCPDDTPAVHRKP
jgi:hypothetical protein